MRIKDDFHHLIDSINDEHILKGYYQLIQNLNSDQNGQLWDKLSSVQQQELLLSYDESFDDKNLISHEQARLHHLRWLKK